MTADHAGDVWRYFQACSRVVTPTDASARASVLYAPCSSDPEVTRLCAAVLTEPERLRARRFARTADARSFVQRRAFRRYCGAAMTGSVRPVSEIEFEETAAGRPYLRDLPNLWFSFSSSVPGFLAASAPGCAIGVDLEDTSADLDAIALARHFFSPTETGALEQMLEPARKQAFLRLWCLKEAALKSIGEGLPFGLAAFRFAADAAPRVVQAPDAYGVPEDYSAHFIEHGGICAALVVRNLASGAAGHGADTGWPP